MQDVDRVDKIQALPQPQRTRRLGVKAEPLRFMSLPESVDGIGGHRDRRRDIGQDAAVRTPEPERVVGLSIDAIALLVHRAVVPATEQGEIRERRRAAFRPVPHVMPLA